MPAIVIPAPINSNHVAPVAAGGTGASTAANARTNLDVYSKSEVTSAIAQSTAILTWIDGGGISNKDFNALKTAARYRLGNMTQFSNGPSSIGTTGTIEVDVIFSYIRQIVYCNGGAAYRFSYDSGSTWTSWIKLT